MDDFTIAMQEDSSLRSGQDYKENVIKCKEFTIVPPKLISMLLSAKRSEIKAESLFRQSLQKENELIEKIKKK